VADDKPPVQKAVELFVYAPVGAACYVRDMLPGMLGVFVARGKREVSSHRTPATPPPPPVPPEVKRRIDESVGAARYAAEGGLGVARDVAGSGLGFAREVAGSALSQFLAMRANGTDFAGVADDGPATRAPEPPTPAPAPAAAAPTPAPAPPPDAGWQTDVPSSEALPIPDYDELSASQVVERLEGLDHESLEAVRRYETGHRGRNTILGKIAQLG
jgi:hypothetical protein